MTAAGEEKERRGRSLSVRCTTRGSAHFDSLEGPATANRIINIDWRSAESLYHGIQKQSGLFGSIMQWAGSA